MFVDCRSEDCVIELFWKGAVLGFLIAAPVGPIGLLCIARTLRAGWSAGFFSGLGAATADAAYAAVAACGLTAITGALTALSKPLHLVGAFLLGVLGVTTLRAKAPREHTDSLVHSGAAAYTSTVVLTLMNPATILSFVAIFAAVGGTQTRSATSALPLVAGTFAGSAAWWLVLSSAVGFGRRAAGRTTLQCVNVLSGACLIAFALYALATG